MQGIRLLSTVSAVFFSACLLGVGTQRAIAQSPTPSQEFDNSSDAGQMPTNGSVSFSSMEPPSIVPACPFPAVPLSTTASQAISLNGTVEVIATGSEVTGRYSPGDGSDLDLENRAFQLTGENKLAEALSIASEIRDPSIRVDALSMIAERHTEAGQFSQTLVVLDEALSAAEVVDDQQTQIAALLKVAEGYVEAEQLDLAFEIVRPLPSTWARDDVLEDIVGVYRNQGNLEQAVSIAEQMNIASFALQDIANDYASQGETERAVEVLSQAVAAFRTIRYDQDQNDQVLPPFLKFIYLTTFASGYTHLNQG
ncbi:MAG: tetratricopeptide repeat protein, partial [Cyanobacteria bacterium J06626_18]